MLTRRDFLMAAGTVARAQAAQVEPSILVHEHVLVNFRRAAYDREEVFRRVKPKLEEIARLGCKRLLECTPNFIGRDPRLLARLAEATGVEIWTNTGLYAARNHEFLPEYSRTETAAQLAKRWVAEWREGVDGMKPRFIKIGVNRGPLGALDRKIVEAAALCAKETGLTIASHTGNGVAALEQLEIVVAAKTRPEKFVWVHADGEKDHAFHEKVAKAGAWVEFDHIGPADAAITRHLEGVRYLEERGLLSRVLVSQDAGYYQPGEPDGGTWKDYSHIYTKFAPRLKAETRRALLWENPRAAFGV